MGNNESVPDGPDLDFIDHITGSGDGGAVPVLTNKDIGGKYKMQNPKVENPASPNSCRSSQNENVISPPRRAQTSESPIDNSKEIFAGDFVNVLDSANRWRMAEVVEIALLSNGENRVLVEYADSGMQEVIHNVDRIALLDDDSIRQDAPSPCEHVYAIDQYVDVLDKFIDKAGVRREKWRVCRVIGKDKTSILVHFEGWSDHFNEWINLKVDSERVRPAFQMSDRACSIDLAAELEVMEMFIKKMKSIELTLVEQSMDGNCLFRAVALQIYGSHELYHRVRDEVVRYMVENKDHFANFVAGNFDEYVKEKGTDKCWGDHLEILAIEEFYDREVIIYSAEAVDPATPINTLRPSIAERTVPPLLVSYHGNNHYNALVHPKRSPPLGLLNTSVIRQCRIDGEKKPM